VSITPQPGNVFDLASRLRMGTVRRFTLLFHERFWASVPPQPAMDQLSFLFANEEMPPVWWTPHPETSNTITAWVGGPRSAVFSEMPSKSLTQTVCTSLAKILSLDPSHVKSLLLACETHDWQADPYALGAYSYIAKGGLEAPAQMTQPISDTLFFAGEHTDTTGHWGTVHAAIRSGLRAATQVLATIA
jgi:monoamine oxidase